MKKSRFLAISLATLLALTGCAGQDLVNTDDVVVGDPSTFPEGSTMAILAERDSIRIGVKFDQPLFGELLDGASAPVGFDVDIAKILAKSLGFSENQIEWIATASTDRLGYIKYGKVDFAVATFTITEDRKKEIGFAGPYFIAGQQLMVASSNNDIGGPEDMIGKRLCVVSGSTGADYFAKNHDAILVAVSGYSDCVDLLRQGSVDATVSDNVILSGLIFANPDFSMKLIGSKISEDPYGVGVMLERNDLRHFFNKALQESFDDGEWKAAWDKHLVSIFGTNTFVPQVDDY